MNTSNEIIMGLRRKKLLAKLMARYKNVSSITLFHLVIAIDLKYSSYVTDAPDLLTDAAYIKKMFKIDVVSAETIINTRKGVII